MKRTKGIALAIAMLLAAAMVLNVNADSSATGGDGTITVKGGITGKTYTLYQLFVLESYDTDNNKNQFSYKVNSEWADFFAQGGAGYAYIHLENGYPTWQGEQNADRAKALANAAFQYAQKHKDKVHVYTSGICQDTGLSFTVPYGYYLMNSSMGTVLSLGTNSPNLEIEEKNEAPGVTKQVKLPTQTDENYVATNTAKIGDKVDFRSVIAVGSGTRQYVYHDKATGLDIDGSTISVKVENRDVDAGKYTISFQNSDKCTFEIQFSDEYIESLSANSTITITYQGTVNASAVTVAENDAWVRYDNVTDATHSTTRTETFAFDIRKVDPANAWLPGAFFKLYDGNGEGKREIKLVWDAEKNGYRPALDGESAVQIETKSGPVRVFGLDKKVYYLEETAAPKGYNLLAQLVTVDLTGGSNTTQQLADGSYTGGIRIENRSGTMLPSTGGTGTTIFYLAGGILAAAALVLLISNKRMDREK